MIIADAIFQQELDAPIRRFMGKVELIKGSTITYTFTGKDALQKYEIHRTGARSKFFGFGITQKIEVNIIDKKKEFSIEKGDILRPSMGVKDKYLAPFCDFYVSEVERDENNNNLKITGFDKIEQAKGFHTADVKISTPYTITQYVKACGSLLGLTVIGVNDSTSYNPANFDGSETLRDVFDAVAEATQTIYYINHNNQLQFKRLDKAGQPVYTIKKDSYFNLSAKIPFSLEEIVSATELGDNVSATTGKKGATQFVRDNPFWDLREDLAQLLDKAIKAVGGLVIQPYDCKWRGNFLIEPGDKIGLIGKDDAVITSFSIDDTITYGGGFKTLSKVEFDDNKDETFRNPSTIGEALNQTFARVDKVNKRIDIVASKAQENSEKIAKIEIDTEKIELEVSNSVKNVIVYFALGESRTVPPLGGWNTVAPENDGTKFMWQKVVTTYNNNKETVAITCISGADGKDGKPGADGKDGKGANNGTELTNQNLNDYYTTEQCGYYFGANNNTVINKPAGVANFGMWLLQVAPNKFVQELHNEQHTYSREYTGSWSQWTIQDNSIKQVSYQYYLSISETELAGGSWMDTQPQWEKDNFIWTRSKIVWTDDSITYTEPILDKALTEALQNSTENKEKVVLLDKTVAGLKVDANTISGRVQHIEKSTADALTSVNKNITTLTQTVETKMSAEDVKIEINKELEKGVDKVQTSTGFTFNQQGLTVSKSGQQMSTTITEDGMKVAKEGQTVLTANSKGVDAENLHATTYLIIGKHIRFEDYGDTGTGCFWIN